MGAGNKTAKGRNQSNERIRIISYAEARVEFEHIMGFYLAVKRRLCIKS